MSNFDRDFYPEFECRVCGEPTASTAGGLCHNCQRQDMIDREPWLDDPNDPINQPKEPPCYGPTEREIAAGYMLWSHDGKCPNCCAKVNEHRGSNLSDKKWDYCVMCHWSSPMWE